MYLTADRSHNELNKRKRYILHVAYIAYIVQLGVSIYIYTLVKTPVNFLDENFLTLRYDYGNSSYTFIAINVVGSKVQAYARS